MHPFDRIRYDRQFYSRFSSLFALLYYIEGFDSTERVDSIDEESIAVGICPQGEIPLNGDNIRINNLDLLDFVNPFEDTSECQNEISNNYPKTYTLFSYFDNIETWLWNSHPIHDNLETIIVFCPNHLIQYGRDWIKRHGKIKRVVTYAQLERELLIAGLNYLNSLCDDLDENSNECIRLRRQQKRICQALREL